MPSDGEVGWTRIPLLSVRSMAIPPGDIPVFSFTSSGGVTSTRIGVSPASRSVRAALTVSASTSTSSGSIVAVALISAPAGMVTVSRLAA